MNAVSEESRPDSVVAEILSGENRELQLRILNLRIYLKKFAKIGDLGFAV